MKCRTLGKFVRKIFSTCLAWVAPALIGNVGDTDMQRFNLAAHIV